MNSLWFKKDLKTATDIGRIHHQLVPETLYYEPWTHQVRHILVTCILHLPRCKFILAYTLHLRRSSYPSKMICAILAV